MGHRIYVLVAVLIFAGCTGGQIPTSDSSKGSASANANPAESPAGTPGKSVATLTANPNPVPAGQDRFGTSTVTWNTGDGTPGQVYVAEDDKPEKLFAGPLSEGSLDASWIGPGSTYEFRLYAGREHKNLLASVKVVRAVK
jgi:hypothetical protein